MSVLSHKVALVTGSTQGLGAAIAVGLAEAGADLLVTGLDTPDDRLQAEALVPQLQAMGVRAQYLPLDITDPVSIKACIEWLAEHYGRLDILVNNAGVMQRQTDLATTAEEFDRCHHINITGTWRISQACIPLLKASTAGRIITISSGAGRRGSPLVPAYSASKSALISLTQSLAGALAEANITANTVCPGVIWTPMCEGFAQLAGEQANQGAVSEEQFIKQMSRQIPLQRPQTPADIAYAVLFFASPQAGNITGQALNVDGGLNMN